ncbi:DUF4304 domain-containing protein [Pectobacterium parmentieri]|uniref:DUF4304 domain-containing protein n=3 Tax=Pectobacterium parmentieri TaxID=1905730 RepID=A0A0H3I069_PECPM|nr:DUF4304 domain-containing protein [Pectobacterium parmentieri]AFI89109.1 Hypothetical protein W5S_0991 [Pectobacterium parmentieri]MBI0470208.1 DUF4304 domain-containing protein [Pectobacterium parmentieri]MBI0492808.1 DUF4304 domain-containing protein [Pectobacterium parmentieri]MBI0550182.1 DUF4304 domain-containing protein [Pectobacterium parmentieri]MBI0553671.1 DUF4304 domain-containing protein [Pectobacterium parmentieri]
MSGEIMNIKLINNFLTSNGFSKDNDINFFRVNNGFLNCINFQRITTGDVFFINLGVHPIFDPKDTPSTFKREIDCYIRTRLSTDKRLSVELFNSSEGISFVINEIEEKAWHFFDLFSSTNDVFSCLSIDDIKNKNIPEKLNSVTVARLVSMCVNYHLFNNNVSMAHDFANYGVCVSGMAIGEKKKFKQILKNIEKYLLP